MRPIPRIQRVERRTATVQEPNLEWQHTTLSHWREGEGSTQPPVLPSACTPQTGHWNVLFCDRSKLRMSASMGLGRTEATEGLGRVMYSLVSPDVKPVPSTH